MGASSLHLNFKNIDAMSPLQFQKQLRSQKARRSLLAESLDAALKSKANQVNAQQLPASS